MINKDTFEADHTNVTALPPGVGRALEEASHPEPEVGQLWRLAWEGLPPRLAVVVGVYSWYCHVLPVSLNPQDRVDEAVVLTDSPLGVPIVVWPQIRTGVGLFVLAEALGTIDVELLNYLASESAVPSGTEDGPSPAEGEDFSSNDFQRRRSFRDRLAIEFAVYSDTDWHDGHLYDEPDLFLDEEAAENVGVSFDSLLGIGLEPSAAYALWQGETPVTPDMVHGLEEHLGDRVHRMLVESPVDLLARQSIDSPVHRADIADIAERDRSSEADLRYSLYGQLVAAPARQTGSRSLALYEQRLSTLIADRLHR